MASLAASNGTLLGFVLEELFNQTIKFLYFLGRWFIDYLLMMCIVLLICYLLQGCGHIGAYNDNDVQLSPRPRKVRYTSVQREIHQEDAAG